MASNKVAPERFAEVYNDLDTYPTLADVAVALGVAHQTVRNTASVLRKKAQLDESVPALVSRKQARPETKSEEPELTPRDHAHVRARRLSEDVTTLVTSSRYPLVNPGAIVVESHLKRVYHRGLGHVDREDTPRTWISDTLRVAPVQDPRGRTFLFTGAQNDAEVDEPFWQNLVAYADYLGAEIVVGPGTYETQWWSENNPLARAYDPLIADHLCFGQMEIGDNFVFCGEMNTLPTAARPISDLTTYSRGKWAVFPHAKIQLKSVPSTNPLLQAHQVMTSGYVTRPKVIPRKAGAKSIFHHVIGATLVEFDAEGDIFCRQVNADTDGSFYDLDLFVQNGEITAGHRARAIVFGDIHRAKLAPRNALATFGLDLQSRHTVNADNLLDVLRPEEAFIHDVYDNETRSHHHANDNAHFWSQAVKKRESVFDEIAEAADFLIDIKRPSTRMIVVESNHDIGLERYVTEGRYRNDGVNIRLGLQLEDAYMAHREAVANAVTAHRRPPHFSLLEHACRAARGTALQHVRWAYDGQSYTVDDVECGHHGFRGPNGSRGTVTGFARLGAKMSIADKHSPEIMDGVYVAGAMELQHGYNKGPSGWCVSHIVQYPNGKRTLVTLQNGKWRAEQGRAAHR